jgi:Zn-dependent M28 family amino/carboxypeptidase
MPVLPADEHDTSALRQAMTAARIRDHLTALQNIARAHGGNRAMGSPGYQASVDYVRDRMTAAGYRVQVQPFRVPYFTEVARASLTPAGGRALAATGADAEVRTMSYSASGDVTAEVQPVDLVLPPTPRPSATSGCEAADFAGFRRGSVALMQRGTCPFTVKARLARDAGAAAVLVMNEGQAGRRDVVTGTLENPGIDIPVVGLSYDAGARLAAAPGTRVHLVTTVQSDYRDTMNVIADSVGGRADRTVVVGAHLDSVPEGPGINDDGSGVAVLLELADQLARQPLVPANRVRFAFWGGEEEGLLGSTHYVRALDPAARGDIAVNLNFDMLGSPNFVRLVYDGDGSSGGPSGPPGSAAVERVFGDYFRSQGLAYEATDFDGRSDYGPFIEAGIPAGGLFSGAEEVKTPEQARVYGGTAGRPMDACYHQACDTTDNLSDLALEQLGDAAADATLRLMLTSQDIRQAR